jgi:hypothetical protein
MSMSDDEPNEITNDEKVTGGACGGSIDEFAEIDGFEGAAATGAASAPPLARRSRTTNPCSSSAIVLFSPHIPKYSRYPTIGSIRSQAVTEIEETVILGIEWHSIRPGTG